MAIPPPPATGNRLDWWQAPAVVRAAVERWLGSAVTAAATQSGGFSPGVATRLRAADGRHVFVKAIGPAPNPDAPAIHRREARNAAALPSAAPAPRLLWSADDLDGWVVLVFEDIAGHAPALPWRPAELDRVLAALARLAEYLTPSPLPAGVVGLASQDSLFARGWWPRLVDAPPAGLDAWSARHAARLAALEADAPAAVAGDTLLHLDIRADNLLLTDDRVVVVDWPHARVGAAWVDAVCFAPSVTMQGGPAPDALLARVPTATSADPAAVTAAIVALAGFFTWEALQPPPPGLPTLRPFQAAQGAVARAWIAERTGLA
jgi:aminoglycoside phosphotransferase (APT) family kinase protein